MRQEERPLRLCDHFVELGDLFAHDVPPLRAVTLDASRVAWVEGTAEKVPLPDASATAVWSLATVHHWKDGRWRRTLTRCPSRRTPTPSSFSPAT